MRINVLFPAGVGAEKPNILFPMLREAFFSALTPFEYV